MYPVKEHGVSRGIHKQRDTKTLTPTQMAQRVAVHTNKYEEDPRTKTLQKFNITPGDIPAFQQTSACWDRRLSYSVFLARGYRSGFQDFTKDLDAGSGSDIRDATLLVPPHDAILSPWTQISQSPPLPPKVLRYVRTAPSSPLPHHRMMQSPTNSRVDLAKQESLDVQLLSQKMAAATECISENMQENAKVLVLLTRALENLTNAALTTQAASGESTDGKTHDYRASPCCGNADLCANVSVNIQRADVKSISRHANPAGSLDGHFHCPSYCSSASSFSSSSSSVSIVPAQPMASQLSISTTSPKVSGKPKPPSTSPRHQDDRHFNVSNDLQLSSYSQNPRDRSGGIGCFHIRRKKNGNKLGGFLFSYHLSHFYRVICLLFFIFYISWIIIMDFIQLSSTSSTSSFITHSSLDATLLFHHLS